ncbi:hypothetical protein SS50377_21194 [Spironucleus salmonicida]|uniref:Uncharacterized protein n=1 Tax=Spironucleus salmonicida TaxID=348837 RepID=V6LT50_9EUKA|nr:hypothetical protein SS50377_21194 [Spironucleus salmonicida]|eukprot:EST43969.1 hypothetical protein SS50377_16276 [Spironucleus salmonicida]
MDNQFNEDNPLDYEQFMAQVAEQKEAPVQFTSKVQTKLGDIEKVTNRQIKKTAQQQLNQHLPLQQAQQEAGALMVLGSQQEFKSTFVPSDNIQVALQKAGLDQLPTTATEKRTNFESSDSEEIDFQDILNNQQTIKLQSDDIIRLRLKLKQNATKLQRWAKIKSKTFRKIHNRERRIEKMQRVTDKLYNASEVAKIAGLNDLANQLISDKNAFLNDENDNYVRLREQELLQEEQDLVQPKTALNSLKFIQNELKRGENNNNLLLQKAELSMQKNKVQNILDDYGENPFVIEEDTMKLPEKLTSNYVQKEVLLVDALEVASDDEQQRVIATMFQKDEIKEMKEQEIVVDKIVVLEGWGEWAGSGASTQDKKKFKDRVQKIEMKQKEKFTEQMNIRTDIDNQGYYQNQKLNQDVLDKYQAKGIRVSDQNYEKYIKQSLLPEFQSINNIKFQTQEQFTTLRGEQAIQQRKIEQNIQQLQKLQRQFAEQKKLIKGQMVPGGLRKNHFD